MDRSAPQRPSPLQVYSLVKDLPRSLVDKYGVSLVPTWNIFQSTWQPTNYTMLVVGNSVTPDQLKGFLQTQSEAFLKNLGIVYISRALNSDEVISLNNTPQVLKIIDLSLKSTDLEQSFAEAVLRLGDKKTLSDILDRVRNQNKTLQELNENLGEMVEQRTANLELSKREVESKLKEVRELIKFIK